MTQYEDRIQIATPEGVQLELTLAGLGSRFMSGVVDGVIKLVVIGLLALALLTLGDLGAAVWVPAVAIVYIAYDILWEMLGQGRTPGKRWNGLRVVRGDGTAIDLRASLVRNLLRFVDGPLLSYLPTVIAITVTARNQRVGDLAADTLVVRERRAGDAPARRDAPVRSLAPDYAEPERGYAPDWDVSAVTAEDVAALVSFLERRDQLAPEVRDRIARRLADAVRPRVGGSDETYVERFLEGVVAAKRERDRVT